MRIRLCFIIGCFLIVAVKCQSTPCTTPNGETTTCVPLLKCLVLIQAAGSNEPVALKFFSESVCDENASTVCCGTSGNYTKIPTTPKPLSKEDAFKALSKEERRDYVLKKLLPSKQYCGMQHTDDYFYNATETSVDEFPWLVYIILRNKKHDNDYFLRIEANCAGALISNQYVLSTKACHHNAKFDWINSNDNLDMMLGVHHIHKKVNCIGTAFGIADCTDPSLRVVSSQWKFYENIVLYRLNKKIEYSDFIRPICLPLEANEIPAAGSLVMASGWGEEQFVKGKSLKLKKRMMYTVMNNTDCETNDLQPNSICGIPLENNTYYICAGDVGGPLMHRHLEINWIAVGLVYQNAPDLCDEVQPVTAIRLTPETVNWVLENIEP